jgi:hypothetical protein
MSPGSPPARSPRVRYLTKIRNLSKIPRTLIGSFHQESIRHLHRYLSEFQFRVNGCQDEDVFAVVIIGLLIKSALRYKNAYWPRDSGFAGFGRLVFG